MIVVSHDQAFLNAVSTDIIHLTSQRLDAYKGDYDDFVKAREERLLNEEREYAAQKAERDHIQVSFPVILDLFSGLSWIFGMICRSVKLRKFC